MVRVCEFSQLGPRAKLNFNSISRLGPVSPNREIPQSGDYSPDWGKVPYCIYIYDVDLDEQKNKYNN